MAKSKDMSGVSLDFYKTAKKTNKKCCSLYWIIILNIKKCLKSLFYIFEGYYYLINLITTYFGS